MDARTILRYLVGQAGAIRAVVASKAALWCGVVLVLLTACARSYDQSWVLEAPAKWLFGPLAFSLVSGTWLFLVGQAGAGRAAAAGEVAAGGGRGHAWCGFMGAYWLTAPVAWLYALPVERHFDSLTAAKANLWLLGIVSLWRVLLMARVFQVVRAVSFFRGLLWVLLAASVEVVAVYVFGPLGFSQAIMAGMSGLRNSPEEDLLLDALGNTAGTALWLAPACFVALLVMRGPASVRPWPPRVAGRVPWGLLALAAACWVGVTIPEQVKLRRNHQLDEALARGEVKQALDLMRRHSRADFGAARPLPPKSYEFTSDDKLGKMMAELRADDAEWMHRHFVRGVQCVIDARLPGRRGWDFERPLTAKDLGGLPLRGIDPAAWLGMLHGLDQSAAGRSWRDSQPVLWDRLLAELEDEPVGADEEAATKRRLKAELRTLAGVAPPAER